MANNKGRHVHLDLVGGLAGDMFLAAAIDAGVVEPGDVESVLRTVGLGPVEVATQRVVRGAIEGTHVAFSGWDEAMESDHRHLSTIRQMLADSDLSKPVIRRATQMFERLGEVEAAVHGIDIDDVHFHEVGAVDSILDFVAAAWIIETLGASWSIGAVPTGRGTIETAHGTIPVPAPATARVLEGFDVESRDVEAELVTPTGATIAATVAESKADRPGGRLVASGFGCGSREVEGISNVVRLMVTETQRAPGDDRWPDDVELEEVIELVTEIDDGSPEVAAHVADKLMESGALDVVREPVQMKKGRLGYRLTVLCRPTDEQSLGRRIFEETTTLGIRRRQLDRRVLPRETRRVETAFGEVDVKVARWDGEVLKIQPEFDSCAAVARSASVEIRRVYDAAMAAAREDEP